MKKITHRQLCQRSSRACEWLTKLQFQVGAVAFGGALVMTGCADRTPADRAVVVDPTPVVTPTPTTTTNTTTPARAATTTPAPATPATSEPTGRVAEQATVVLDEETLDVQKRTVPAGGVVIKKDVETRQVTQPVELRTETVEVERLSPEEARERQLAAKGGTIDEKGEIFVPLEREVAVVEKDVQPREVVTATTKTGVEQEEVGATLRREVVDIERQGSGQSAQTTSPSNQAGAPTGRTGTQSSPSSQAQQPTSSQSTQAQQPMEQRIRTDLRQANLGLQEQQINQMQIQVEQNTVTLMGTVPNQETSRAIEQRIRQMEGVQNVQNQLRIAQ